MKKTFTILIAAIAAIMLITQPVKVMGQTTITMSSQGWTSGSALTSTTISDDYFTITFEQNTGSSAPAYYTNSPAGARLYAVNSMTITAEDDVTITTVEYTFNGKINKKKYGEWTATGDDDTEVSGNYNNTSNSDYTMSGVTLTWEGEASVVVFQNTGNSGTNVAVTTVEVSYTTGGGDTYSVTYRANGGTGSNFVDNNSGAGYANGTTVTVVTNEGDSGHPNFTKTGYSVILWSDKADWEDPEANLYDPTDDDENTFEITGNTDLYAVWDINKYTVALPSISGVTLSATYGTSSSITVGGSAQIDYNTEITVGATGLDAGKAFVWDVYKTGESSTKVTVTNNKFNVPDFDVTISGEIVDLDYNNTYTSNVTLSTTGGTSASTCKVAISNVEYDGIKAGTSSAYGAWQVTVPANTTKLHLHLAGWNSENVTLSVAPSDYSTAIALTANSGISGSGSTYTFSGDPSTDSYYKIITFADPLEEAVTLTFTATGGYRFVVWGVNAEMSTDPYITAADVDIDDYATAGSITYTVHNIPEPAGVLSASVKTGDWLNLGTVSTDVPFTCTKNPNAVERTATVTLTYTYGDSKTTTLDVTVTQAPKVVTYTYTLATSIESGRHYILVGYEGVTPYAMGAQNGNVRNAISITDEGDDVVSFTSDKGVREIVINGPEIITKNDKPVEVYTLYDAAETGYVYASSSSSNNIGTRTYNTGADSQWKIVFEEENSNFVVTAQGTNSRNILKYNYNGGNPRFSCYGSGTSLATLLYLYVKNEVTPQYDFYMDIAAWTVSQTTGDENKTDGWYFIASPVNGDIDPEDVDNMLTADENVYHTYDLYRLSGNTLENYRNENTHDFVIANGNGYLYANKNNTTLKFSGSSIKIYSTDDNTVTPSHSGWNLIGNPYTFPVKVSRAFSELNNGSAVNSMDANSIINPGAGIIVYGTEDVTFTKYEPTDQSSGPSNINIMLAQQVASRDGSSTTSVAIDNAVVSFNSNSRLPKFTLLEGNAKLYIPQNGEDYAIAFSNRQGDMPLNFKTTETGNYTISFEGNNMNLRGIYLIDILAGQEIDLSVNPSYTFIGSPVDKAERFKIVFKNVGSNGEDIFAYQNGNDIIVSGEGELQIFDVTGRSVMTTTISGVETINVPTMGVYIFRLIGSEIKTQKIVVR